MERQTSPSFAALHIFRHVLVHSSTCGCNEMEKEGGLLARLAERHCIAVVCGCFIPVNVAKETYNNRSLLVQLL